MPQAIGSNAKIIYQTESTFKQLPTTPNATKLEVKSISLGFKRNLITSETLRGTRNAVMPVLGNVIVEGSINLELQANIGSWWKYTLGSVETTGTGPYTHVFKVGSSLPSFVIEAGLTDVSNYYLYLGNKVNRMSLRVTPEGFQELTFDIIGAKEILSTTSFDDTPNIFSFAPFTGFEASVEEGGSTLLTVSEITISIENDLDASIRTIGGAGEIYALPEGKVKVSGTLKTIYQNKTLYEKAKNSTETSLKIKFTRGNGTGSEGNEYLEIFCPEIKFEPKAPEISGPQGIYLELPFIAYYDNSTEATTMQIVLKNMQATI